MVKNLQRSLPYIETLLKEKRYKNRIEMLKRYPPFVLHAIYEVLHNVINGNCKISINQRNALWRHRKALEQVVKAIRAKQKNTNNVFYKQSGHGLLSVLLPIVASVIGGIVGSR